MPIFPYRTISIGALIVWLIVSMFTMVVSIVLALVLYRLIVGRPGEPGLAAVLRRKLEARQQRASSLRQADGPDRGSM